VLPCNLDAGELAEYTKAYDSFISLTPDIDKHARVRDLALTRDIGSFMLEDGDLYFCQPVDGRVWAFVFKGKGTFRFRPPIKVERDQISRYFETDSLNEPFSSLVVLFADTTANELSRKLVFAPTADAEDLSRTIKRTIKLITDDDTKSLDSEFATAMLESEHNELFYAHINTQDRGQLLFEIDPYNYEKVRLLRAKESVMGNQFDVICQFHSQSDLRAGVPDNEDIIDLVTVEHYDIESWIENGLDFSSKVGMTLRTLVKQQWFSFSLHEDLSIDSIIWKGGKHAEFHRSKKQSDFWMKSDSVMIPGQQAECTVCYHGDLLERHETGFITFASSYSWYPRTGSRGSSTYHLTFHAPKELKVASVGELLSLKEQDDVVTTQWAPSQSIRNASFAIGNYREFVFEDPKIPRITVYRAETSIQRYGMEKEVGGDIVNSVRMFQRVFGEVPYSSFFAAEIPYYHGEAFPGLIHLSWVTYQNTDFRGEDDVFRAHEVAHQWWGIGVDFKTYHDQWLSEGFSEYSGLWYMQTVRKDNKKFFKMLDEWKKEILGNRKYLFGSGQEAGPIWLGYRTEGTKTSGDYSLIIYKKGAWVLHMLRLMLLDLKTMNEDRFTALMKDFYLTYRGKKASTNDFKRIVDKHLGEDMGWFFDQWVYGIHIPKYEFAYNVISTADGKYKVRCRVHQEGVSPDFKMYVPILVEFGDDKFVRLRVSVTGATAEFDLPPLPLKPKDIIFNDLSGVLCEVDNVTWK